MINALFVFGARFGRGGRVFCGGLFRFCFFRKGRGVFGKSHHFVHRQRKRNALPRGVEAYGFVERVQNVFLKFLSDQNHHHFFFRLHGDAEKRFGLFVGGAFGVNDRAAARADAARRVHNLFGKSRVHYANDKGAESSRYIPANRYLP